MKRTMLFAAGALAAVLLVATIALRPGSGKPALAASPVGPTISVGTPSLVSGQIRVPISTSGAVPNAYRGFNLELTWDPSVLTFSSVDETGAIAAVTGLCSTPDTTTFAPNYGANLNYGCNGLGTSTTSTGLLVTVIFTPVSGCTQLHLVTPAESTAAFGYPDNSTYTVDDASVAPQSNVLVDGTTNNLGQTCAAGPIPTPTPTATNTVIPTATSTPCPLAPCTPTPTNTLVPTVTNTPFPTPAGGYRTVTPSATPPTPGTNTPPATTAPGGSAPGGAAPGGGAAPAGGAPAGGAGAGLIRPPNTGEGAAGASSAPFTALVIAAAMLLAGSGAAYAWWRRERRA